MSRRVPGALALLIVLRALVPAAASAAAQRPSIPPAPAPAPATALDSLIALAFAANPTIEAAAARARAATAAIGPAGARPDPTLTLGLRDFPLWDPGFYDNFTMKMIGVGQTLPFPGKLALERRAAAREAEAAEARHLAARLAVARQVKEAYYELALAEQLLEIVRRTQRVLLGLASATEASYRAGRVAQEDLLRARVEATRLGEEASALAEQRTASLARLNALLDRPSDVTVGDPRIPASIARAAVADSASAVRFVSAALGARAADSPLPPLRELQERAVRRSPMLVAHEAMIAARAARRDRARKEHLPDFDISLEYGQRAGFTDLVTAQVAVPIRLQKGRKQDQLVVQAEAELSAAEAEHREAVNTLRADVAARYGEAERSRTQLALYVKAILPQGRAALAAATSSFAVGRTDFPSLLGAQSTLYGYELQQARALSDFAKAIAALEEATSQEVLP